MPMGLLRIFEVIAILADLWTVPLGTGTDLSPRASHAVNGLVPVFLDETGND